MAEYIECRKCDSPYCDGCNTLTLSKMLHARKFDCLLDEHHCINPCADVVPVVRCKDCVHWYDREEVCLKIYSDGTVSPYAWQFRGADDFCSYGERRDSDG
jgi:hypothetical protein